MESLDDAYGKPAGPHDLDPTHLHALAVRVQQLALRIESLAGALDVVKERGDHRDAKLEEIQSDVADVNRSVAKIDSEVNEILHKEALFSEEQIKTLKDIVLGRDRKRWLWDRVKVYLLYGTSTIAFVWAIRELFPAAGRLLKSVLP